jgi:hypothetical protein
MYKSIYTIFMYLFYYDNSMSLMLNAYVCTMQKLYRELKAPNKFLLFFSNVRNSRRESTFTSVGGPIWTAQGMVGLGMQLCLCDIGTVYSIGYSRGHGPNNYKETKPSMSSLLAFKRVYRLEWRYSQSCWYFRPFLWTFSLFHSPPPFPVWISIGYVL